MPSEPVLVQLAAPRCPHHQRDDLGAVAVVRQDLQVHVQGPRHISTWDVSRLRTSMHQLEKRSLPLPRHKLGHMSDIQMTLGKPSGIMFWCCGGPTDEVIHEGGVVLVGQVDDGRHRGVGPQQAPAGSSCGGGVESGSSCFSETGST